MDTGTKPEDKRWFSRAEAIAIMEKIDEDMDDPEVEKVLYHLLSCEDLEAELCLSGYIHDEDMGGVK